MVLAVSLYSGEWTIVSENSTGMILEWERDDVPAVSIMGMAGAKEHLKILITGALKALEPFGEDASALCALAKFVGNRDY